MKYSYSLCLTILLSVIAMPGNAHHSFSMVDRSQAKLIEGQVVDWHFNAPHVWLYIEAPDENGDIVRWGAEGGAPVHAIRMGVTGNTFQIGESVKIVMTPLRDGRPAGGVCFVAKEGGKIMMFNDGSCLAPVVLQQWQENDWLEHGTHMDVHPIAMPQ